MPAMSWKRPTRICSVARLDDPKILRRKLQDNVDKYKVEAVGTIGHTHRFRGMADFYWDMTTSPFAQRYVEQVLPGNSKLAHSSQGAEVLMTFHSRAVETVQVHAWDRPAAEC